MREKKSEDIPKVLEERSKKALSLIVENSIYFAHPVNYYFGSNFNVHGTKEIELLKIISEKFEEYIPHNPNQPFHQENYQYWKQTTGKGMNYYFDIILPKMSAGIGLSFNDGFFGTGVFGELENIQNQDKPIYEINEAGIITPINKLDHSRSLSIEETRKRIYG